MPVPVSKGMARTIDTHKFVLGSRLIHQTPVQQFQHINEEQMINQSLNSLCTKYLTKFRIIRNPSQSNKKKRKEKKKR